MAHDITIILDKAGCVKNKVEQLEDGAVALDNHLDENWSSIPPLVRGEMHEALEHAQVILTNLCGSSSIEGYSLDNCIEEIEDLLPDE